MQYTVLGQLITNTMPYIVKGIVVTYLYMWKMYEWLLQSDVHETFY